MKICQIGPTQCDFHFGPGGACMLNISVLSVRSMLGFGRGSKSLRDSFRDSFLGRLGRRFSTDLRCRAPLRTVAAGFVVSTAGFRPPVVFTAGFKPPSVSPAVVGWAPMAVSTVSCCDTNNAELSTHNIW